MPYIIGIDLGTTNSCLAYVDLKHPSLSINYFKIPQLTNVGTIESLSTLPSFIYLSAEGEWPKGTLNLPWNKNNKAIVGSFALKAGAKIPSRMIQSAKSWLCHSAANRKDKILPFNPDFLGEKKSPIEATTEYLNHLRNAWNYGMGRKNVEDEFEEQTIILTVPASFDEVARTLTVEAAKKAGFKNLTLLEEPQAAFYAWLSQNNFLKTFKENDTILVCDVGGGTTDFSLIEVKKDKDQLTFSRMAVGDHLLLGGDNIDDALTHLIEQKILEKGHAEFTSTQWQKIRSTARFAKEALLDNSLDEYKVIIQGTGSKVIEGSITLVLQAQEVKDFVLKGFFGTYSLEEALQLKKTFGLKKMGLPFEEEPSITKHLAKFLSTALRQGQAPNYVLFNGGSMKPKAFQEAILNNLRLWFPDTVIQSLESVSLDLAVSRGAAYYGKAKRGFGTKIEGGIARSFYVEVKTNDTDTKLLCVLQRGAEEGSTFEMAQDFWISPNTPVAFKLYSSHVRLSDTFEQLVDFDPLEIQQLPPIHTILRFGKDVKASKEPVPVKLQVVLTAIGTIELWLHSQKTNHRWLLEFQLKSSEGLDDAINTVQDKRKEETFDAQELDKTLQLIKTFFTEDTSLKPSVLMDQLENSIGLKRNDWPLSVLRAIAKELLDLSHVRKKTNEHEIRWWNLMGFSLRPGYGYPLDDYKMKDFWKIILGELPFNPKKNNVNIHKWICLRRVAGGFSKGQQTQLANDILSSFLQKNGKIEIQNKEEYQYVEKLRLIGSFELLETSLKVKLGNALMERFKKQGVLKGEDWAFARLGNRHLLYGTYSNLIPAKHREEWIKALLDANKVSQEQKFFLISSIGRKIEEKEWNISKGLVNEIIQFFEQSEYYSPLKKNLEEVQKFTEEEADVMLGDHVPVGLTLQT